MDEKLREIRKRLRLAMNGIISTSMRQKGMNYKLIFGVPLPEIKELASSYEVDEELARAMWKEDVREMKILATMLYPAKKMTQEEALKWMEEIPYPEIAEQCCNNLFSNVNQPVELALSFLSDKESDFGRVAGFLLFAQLFKKKIPVESTQKGLFLAECYNTMHPEDKPLEEISWVEKNSVVSALKFFGRQSVENADDALSVVVCEDNNSKELKEYYNNLKFEFEYYDNE